MRIKTKKRDDQTYIIIKASIDTYNIQKTKKQT